MEEEVRRFYERAASRATDTHIRQLLDDLAAEERSHESRAEQLEKTELKPDVRRQEEDARMRLLVLQIVQPGLAGLMDGSVSTLVPVFAAAFSTRSSWTAFAVGLADRELLTATARPATPGDVGNSIPTAWPIRGVRYPVHGRGFRG